MNLTLSFDLDNDAFVLPDSGGAIAADEVAATLHKTAERIEDADPLTIGDHGGIIDRNGNTVGRWDVR